MTETTTNVKAEHYLFPLHRELLDVGAMEMDETLRYLLQQVLHQPQMVEICNEQGAVRKFRVDYEEGLLEGRGIKGFFGHYDGDNLLVTPTGEDQLTIVEQPKITPKWLERVGLPSEKLAKTDAVLQAMQGWKQTGESWFDLYTSTQQLLTQPTDEALLCLPHLRDLELFEYQLKTVRTVINHFGGRVLLCDEVGLGKTIEAGMAMMEYIVRGLAKRILILVPPSLVEQWHTEMRRKFNQDFIRFDDPDFVKLGPQSWVQCNKVIASIHTAKRENHREMILKEPYDLVIVDEAHHLTNQKTVAWKLVNSIRKKYIFLLTATPVQNKLAELYTLITLLKPGQLRTYSYFRRNFVKDSTGLEAKNLDQLRMLLSQVMIRNKRSAVDVQFTRRHASTRTVDLLPQEQEIYDGISAFVRANYHNVDSALNKMVLRSLQEEMGSSFHALLPTLERVVERIPADSREAMYIRDLVQATADVLHYRDKPHPKIICLLDILTQFDDKMLVFTKYRATQAFIARFLGDHGFRVAQFHGGMRRKEKEEHIEMFRTTAQVLVSTEAGGEGRNLQFCNGMVNFDLPWNPMAIEQRIGRIHRVGQTRDVSVFNLVANNTIEYHILDLLDRKINMFELVVGEMDMVLGNIESKQEFADMVLDAWVEATDVGVLGERLAHIADQLLDNKRQYLQVKQLDQRLFGDAFGYSEKGVAAG